MFDMCQIVYMVVVVLCALGIHGKPSLSFNLPSLASFRGLNVAGGSAEDNLKNLKEYSGRRVRNDSLRMVYFHDQTVAVVELGPKKLLLNCELIEVYEPEEALKVLGDLKSLTTPVHISMYEMMTLIMQCQQIDKPVKREIDSNSVRSMNGRGLLNNNPLTLLSGIIPGTKWCGTGDIASDYHDLGADSKVDVCCRAHDLCPVKVRAYSARYNLTNDSLYTKSHCRCDDSLFNCLRNNDSPTANIMGNIYFNIVQVPCVDETKGHGRKFRKARNNF